MRAVVQRVAGASVNIAGEEAASIGRGLVVLVGVAEGDGPADADALAAKLAGLRIFADTEGRMNRSVVEASGAVLVISQFTLLGDTRRGRRPSFTRAARPEEAEPLVARVADRLAGLGVPVRTGRFGARMLVELANDGPVTLVVDVIDGSVV